MPDDWIHCLFTGSIVGQDYESRHCWVNQLLDSPAGFLGERHRILLHDLETAMKLSKVCWWAGFAATLHIDVDNLPKQIRSHLESVVKPIKDVGSGRLPKGAEVIDKTKMLSKTEDSRDISGFLRRLFLKVHTKVGVSILVDNRTSKEVFILLEPNTLLRTTWDYVNQVPLKGIFVDDHPYNELPLTEPRIIPHPNYAEKAETPPHIGDCLDLGLLKYLFQ